MPDYQRLHELEFSFTNRTDGFYEVETKFIEYPSYPPELRREGERILFSEPNSFSLGRINIPEPLKAPFSIDKAISLGRTLLIDNLNFLYPPVPDFSYRMIRITYVYEDRDLDWLPWELMTYTVIPPTIRERHVVLRRYPANAGEATGKFDLPLNVALLNLSGQAKRRDEVGQLGSLLFDGFAEEARSLGGIEWGPFSTMKTGEAQHIFFDSSSDSSVRSLEDLLNDMREKRTALRPPRLLTLQDLSSDASRAIYWGAWFVRQALMAGADAVLFAVLDPVSAAQFFRMFYRKIMHNWPLDQSVRAAQQMDSEYWRSSIFAARRDGEFGLLLTRAVAEALSQKISVSPPETQRRRRVRRGRVTKGATPPEIDSRAVRLKTDLLHGARQSLESMKASTEAEVNNVLSKIAFDEERHGVDEVVRVRQTVREHSEVIQKHEQTLFSLDKADPKDLQAGLGRWTNLWITEHNDSQPARPIEAFDPLISRQPYNLHLQIGPRRIEAVVSEQFNEDALKGVLELLGEVTLDVMFFSTENDFELLGDELKHPAGEDDKLEDHGAKRRSVARAKLVLPQYGSSTELRIIIIPGEPGHRRLRTCIYYRNVLLQSVLIEAEVAPVGSETKAQAGSSERVITGRTVDYLATVDFALLNELPQPSLTLFVNDDGAGTHWVGAFSSGDTSAFGLNSGDMRVFDDKTLEIRGGDLRDVLADIEGPGAYKLTATMPLNDDNVKLREKYFADLAVSGRRLFHDLFNVTAGDNAARLENFRNTITNSHIVSIARCRDGVTVPWAALYANYLDINSSEPKTLCGIFKKQLADNKWTTDGNSSPVLVEKHDLLDDPKACRSQSNCPLNGERSDFTICPFGFWGFMHQIEQPLQQVNPTPIDTVPAELKDYNFGQTSFLTRPAKDHVKVAVGAYQGIPGAKDHGEDIKRLNNGSTVDLAYRENRDQIMTVLTKGGQHVYYFYCHGESDKAHKIFKLKVGEVGKAGFIESADLGSGKIKWMMPNPLFVMNGCDSVAITPDETHGFLTTLKMLGASGIVGTEIKVWTQLARPVGLQLLSYLVDGKSIGEAFLEMRKYMLRHLNPLGLAYSYYSPATLHFHDPDNCKWCASHSH